MSPAMIARCTLLTAWLVAAPAALAAQGSALLPGSVTASVGEGVGSAALSCDACASSRNTGIAGLARVGLVARTNLVFALEGSGWTKEFANSTGSATAQMLFGDLVAQWYPMASSTFFVKGGGGFSQIKDEVTTSGLPNTTIQSTSPAFVLGVGWDLLVTRRVAVTPYVDFDMSTKSSANVNSLTSSQQLGGNLVHAGLAVSWRR